MLAYASRGTDLRSGGVLGSGRVGHGCLLELTALHGADVFPWPASGDEVAISVDGLGVGGARIVAGPQVLPLGRGAEGSDGLVN